MILILIQNVIHLSIKSCIMSDVLSQALCVFSHTNVIAIIIAVILLLLIVLNFKACVRVCRNIVKQIEKKLFVFVVAICVCGILVVYMGSDYAHAHWLYGLIQSMATSFSMFFGKLDLPDSFMMKDNGWYMLLILLIYCCAMLTTIAILLKFISFRLRSWIRLRWYGCVKKPSKVNLFWGVNEPSYMLAHDIIKTHPDQQIVFICTNDIRDNDNYETIGVGRMFDLMSLQRKDMERLEDFGALVANCHVDLSHINAEEGASVLRLLQLDAVEELLSGSQEARIFFLSEDEDKNILNATNLMRDDSISQHQNAHIYIHARRSTKNDIYNYYSYYSASRTKMSVIDSSFLSVAYLKTQPQLHPVNSVDVDVETSTVSSPFNTMIIGFGETGQEAFKFVYEFGSFVTKSGSKTPFSCVAIDSNMDNIEGAVRTQMPEIGEDELKLYSTNIHSKPFWEIIHERICSLQYIFITINDDTKALSLALDIYNYAARYCSDHLEYLKIFVRAHSSDSARYMSDVVDKLTTTGKGEIVIFGAPETLYTYDIIIDDMIVTRAMRYHYAYLLACCSSDDINALAKLSPADLWRRDFGCNALNTNADIFEKVNEISFKIEQNISNSLHIDTKMALLGVKDHVSSLSTYRESIRQCAPNTVFSTATLESTRLLNVAKCEHERWNAASRIMGMRYSDTKSFVKHTHNSLCPWESLADDKTRSYDCIVVDVSMKLYEEQFISKE